MSKQAGSKKRAPSGDVAAFGTFAVAALTAADCPSHVAPAARAEWQRLISLHNGPDAAPRFLASDRICLTTYCELWSDYLDARAQCRGRIVTGKPGEESRSSWHMAAIDLQRQLRLLAVEMGLTPASRPRVHRPGEPPKTATVVNPKPSTATAPTDPLAGLRVVG